MSDVKRATNWGSVHGLVVGGGVIKSRSSCEELLKARTTVKFQMFILEAPSVKD